MVIVQHYWWDERTRNGVNASVTFTPKTIGSTGTITPNLTDAAEKAWIKTRSWKVTPDGMTGYLAVPLTPNDDPDLTAFGGYEVAPDGETARTVAIPSTAGTTTVTTQMQAALAKLSPPITVTVGATVKAVWLTDVATISNPPSPPDSFFDATATQAAIAAGILAHDEDTEAHPDIRALISGGGGTVADATTTTKGKARILGGTADAPTVPYSAVTGAPTSLPPSGGAGGVLGGSFPNPSFAVDMATQSELDAVAATRLPTLVPTATFTSGSHTPASGEMARYAPTSNVSVTLPAASASQRFGVANVLAVTSTFTATFTCAGADTFSDGSTSLVLKPGERAVLIGASGGFTVESRTVIGAGTTTVRSVSTNTTAVAGEFLKVDATGAARTVTPPGSPATGAEVIVMKTDSSANAVTWSGQVDGDAGGAQLVAQWAAASFVYDGTQWLLRSTNLAAGAASLLTAVTATKTANYTANTGQLVPVDTTGGTVTITSPASGGAFAVRWKAGTAAPAIAANSGYTIAGGASVTMALAPGTSTGELLVYQAFGTDYQSVGAVKPQAALDGRYAPAVLVRSFGAKGDDSTDDTTALQNALNAVPANGTLHLDENKTYKITAALAWPTTVAIDGHGASIHQTNVNADALVSIDGADLGLRNIYIKGAVAGSPAGTGRGVVCDRSANPNVNRVVLDRVFVTSFGGDGVWMSNPIVTEFSRVDSQLNAGHGINLHGVTAGAAGTSFTLNSCFANGNTKAGYYVNTMTYCSFNSCAADGNGIGYEVIACDGIAFSGCGAESQVNNNATATGYAGYSWKVNGSYGVTLTGCYAYDQPSIAVWVTGNAGQVVLTGFKELNPHSGATYGLQTDAGCTATQVHCAFVKPVNLASSTTLTVNDTNGGLIVPGDVTASRFVTSTGFTLPGLAPRFRLPSFRSASTIQNFQSGHPFTTTGSTGVASSNLNDTSTYVRGSQSVSVTTAGTGAQARVRATGLSAMDLTGKAIRVIFKVDDVTHLNYINFYLGSGGLTNFFQWTVHTHSTTATNYVQSGEWVSVVLQWSDVASVSGSYTYTGGTPSTKSGFTDMQFALYDDAAGAVTYHLQSIEFINDTSDTFPSGVISITFDDSYQTVWDNARPRMDSYGYRGTLYTIADAIGAGGSLTLPELQTFQGLSGWDVAGHAYSSANHNQTNGFASLTSAAVNDEFRNLKSWMVKNGFSGDTFAYPKGHFDKTTDGVMIDQIAAQYWSASRTIVSELKEHLSPGMPQRVRALSAINDGSGLGGYPVSSLIATNGPLDQTKNAGAWLILCFHDVPTGTPTVSSQCSQAGFNSVMDAIQSRGIPVAPISEVLRYYS